MKCSLKKLDNLKAHQDKKGSKGVNSNGIIRKNGVKQEELLRIPSNNLDADQEIPEDLQIKFKKMMYDSSFFEK